MNVNEDINVNDNYPAEDNTLQLFNDGLSVLLERNQADLVESRARITHLEEDVANFMSSRLLAEGVTVDLNSQLIIAKHECTELDNALVLKGVNLENLNAAYNERIKNSVIQARETQNLTDEIHAAVAREATLANQLELSRSRESDLTLEKDAAVALGNSLQAQS